MTSQGLHHRNGVHFFKVILENNLRDGKLMVPKSFVKRYWQEISSTVVLSLPNGTEWKVYWLKRDGDVWFRNGWHEFAKYLSLKESQFLFFGFEGNSKFSVIVLGTNCLEIKYPLSSSRGGEDVEKNEGRNNGYESGKRMPISQSFYSSLTHKKMKSIPEEEPQGYNNVHPATKHVGKKKECVAGFDSYNLNNCGISFLEEDFDEKIKTFHEEVRSSFHSDKPYFMCSLRRSYIERDLLVIPNEFAKPFLHFKEGGATLFVDQKGAWDVKLKLTSRQLTFTGGWKKFLADNSLKLGDVCIFELINDKQVSFGVLIHRFEEESSTSHIKEHKGPCHQQPSSWHRNHEISKTKNRFMITQNSFTLEMRSCASSSHYVVIPMDFIRNFGVQNNTFATLRIGERTWSVKILYYEESSNARFSQGWSRFVRDCRLVVGDSCRFHMMDKDNLEFQVSIIREKLNI